MWAAIITSVLVLRNSYQMGANPDLDLTILSFSSKPGASTMALISATRDAAFFHIPSTVVYGSFI